jgi:hypothetical protein
LAAKQLLALIPLLRLSSVIIGNSKITATSLPEIYPDDECKLLILEDFDKERDILKIHHQQAQPTTVQEFPKTFALKYGAEMVENAQGVKAGKN